MGSRLKIEQASIADVDGLVAVEQAAFDPALYTWMTRRQFQRHIVSRSAVLLVAKNAAGEVLGYALGFLRRNARYLRLYSLAVHPAHQGGRVGAELFPAIEQAALERGMRGMQLEIRADNAKLHDRYLKIGYRPFGSVADYYPDGAGCTKLKVDLPR